MTIISCYLSGDLSTPRYKLENDPMCGMTMGGREDCFWDCEIDELGFGNGPIISTPECLLDCFDEVGYVIMGMSFKYAIKFLG